MQLGGRRLVDLLDEVHMTQQVREGHEEGEGHLLRTGRRDVRATHLIMKRGFNSTLKIAIHVNVTL